MPRAWPARSHFPTGTGRRRPTLPRGSTTRCRVARRSGATFTQCRTAPGSASTPRSISAAAASSAPISHGRPLSTTRLSPRNSTNFSSLSAATTPPSTWNASTQTTRVFGRNSIAKVSRFPTLPFTAPRRTVCPGSWAYSSSQAPGSLPHSRLASRWPPGSRRSKSRHPLLQSRVLCVMRVPDGFTQALVELGPVENDFLCVHRGDGGERNGKVAGVLHVDHQLPAAVPRNLPNGAKGLVMLGDEDFEAFLDRIHPATPAALRSMQPTGNLRLRHTYRRSPAANRRSTICE